MEPEINFTFQELPEEYKSINNPFHCTITQKIYSNFSYYYYKNNQNENFPNKSIFETLVHSKFMTYSYFDKNYTKKDFEEKNDISCDSVLNVVICIEDKCLILESISEKLLIDFIEKLEITKINVTNPINDLYKSDVNTDAINEVLTFCKELNFKYDINDFIRITFFSILSFLIRRHFYPSYFFKNKNFFLFDQNLNSETIYEQEFEDSIHNFMKNRNSDFNANFKHFKGKLG